MKFDHITAEHLTLRIAQSADEIKAAQALRYDIFYREMGAQPIGDMATLGLDYDSYDAICDHLVVVDEKASQGQYIVGTYRLLDLDRAKQHNVCLYTETEFNLDALKATGGRILEMSRSCIHADYRTKTAINLLWKGIAAWVFKNKIDYVIGVPSFPGVDVQDHIKALSYLQAFHKAPSAISPIVHTQYSRPIDFIPQDELNLKEVFNDLPPLIKGYLRIGVSVGEGVYVDELFNMTDICVVLDVANAADRYLKHYKRYDTE
jgi:putative hemolysin